VAALPAALAAMDAVIRNAGVSSATHPHDPVATASKGELMRCFEVNCCGPQLLTQALLPLLNGGGGGQGEQQKQKQVLFLGSDMGCVSSTWRPLP